MSTSAPSASLMVSAGPICTATPDLADVGSVDGLDFDIRELSDGLILMENQYGENHAETAQAHFILGGLHQMKTTPSNKEALFHVQTAYNIRLSIFGPGSSILLVTKRVLASFLNSNDATLESGLLMIHECIEQAINILGRPHLTVSNLYMDLGSGLRRMADVQKPMGSSSDLCSASSITAKALLDDSLAAYEESARICKEVFGSHHTETLASLKPCAIAALLCGREDKASFFSSQIQLLEEMDQLGITQSGFEQVAAPTQFRM